MDTSKKNFDVILSFVKNFRVTIQGFPIIDSVFSTIKTLDVFTVDETEIRIVEDNWSNSFPFNLYFTIDELAQSLIENLSDIPISVIKKLQIIATAKLLEKVLASVKISRVNVLFTFLERLSAVALVNIKSPRIIAEATVGMWRKLSMWDYDDTPQLVPMSYWNALLLDDLDYKEGQEYI